MKYLNYKRVILRKAICGIETNTVETKAKQQISVCISVETNIFQRIPSTSATVEHFCDYESTYVDTISTSSLFMFIPLHQYQ